MAVLDKDKVHVYEGRQYVATYDRVPGVELTAEELDRVRTTPQAEPVPEPTHWPSVEHAHFMAVAKHLRPSLPEQAYELLWRSYTRKVVE